MNLSTSSLEAYEGVDEFSRLKSLLPEEIRYRVIVTEARPSSRDFIQISREDSERLAIQINPKVWPQLKQAERDLLFWHYVSRIQKNLMPSTNWEANIVKGGVLLALAELTSQNLIVFAIALIVVGLSAHQLYQNNRGEQALKAATTADQGAIALAIHYGYTYHDAYTALKDSLKYLASHAEKPRQRYHYQTRLKVLEVCAKKSQEPDLFSTRAIALDLNPTSENQFYRPQLSKRSNPKHRPFPI